ncbi:hypothetical protein QUF64_04480 [Anaerolineales bacterium HSG6]|nr:hypothetical protein [Anaerolineales bacterium HSG6]
MNLESLEKKFKKMTWQQQMGNLASTLGRVSNHAKSIESDQIVTNGLREAAHIIEWSVSDVPPEFAFELANIQRELSAWRRIWPVEGARHLLALHARNQSHRLLQMGGYYQTS